MNKYKFFFFFLCFYLQLALILQKNKVKGGFF